MSFGGVLSTSNSLRHVNCVIGFSVVSTVRRKIKCVSSGREINMCTHAT